MSTDLCWRLTGIGNDCEDPYPSLSDYHDYEPNLEFDDTELQTTSNNGELCASGYTASLSYN